MKPTENKEELKPCPYHGDSSAMEFSGASKNFAACRKCDREGETWYRPVENWNSAFCWKEIELLKSNIKQLCVDQQRQLDSLESRLAEKDRLLQKAVKQIEEEQSNAYEDGRSVYARNLQPLIEEIRSSVGGSK